MQQKEDPGTRPGQAQAGMTVEKKRQHKDYTCGAAAFLLKTLIS